jgi:hypothetical protein
MRDSFGNLIVLDAGRQAKPESDEDKDKVFVFTPADVIPLDYLVSGI